MKIAINTKKINKDTKHNQDWYNTELSVNELMNHIKKGYAFTNVPLKKDYTTLAINNCNQPTILCLDIDDKDNVKLDDAINNIAIKKTAAFIYTTASHTKEQHRFRIVFILENPIQHDEYQLIYNSLSNNVIPADQQANNSNRLWYGNTNADFYIIDLNNTLKEKHINQLITQDTYNANQPTTAITAPTKDTAIRMIKYIPANDIEYLEWFKVYSSVFNSYDNTTALEIITAWGGNDKNDVKKSQNILNKITIRTLIYYAKKYGYVPSQDEQKELKNDYFELDEHGTADYLHSILKYKYIYNVTLKIWQCYNGIKWIDDHKESIYNIAIKLINKRFDELLSNETQEENVKFLKKEKLKAQKIAYIRNAVSILIHKDGMSAEENDFDKESYIINNQNCVIDLRELDIIPHSAHFLCKKVSNMFYDTNADTSVFLKDLEIWLPDKELRIDFLRIVSTALLGESVLQILTILYGGGANGKSLCLAVIQKALGDYAVKININSLLDNKMNTQNYEVALLKGARLVLTSEIPEGRFFDSSKIKDLTGNDTITARLPYGLPFSFKPSYTLICAGNNKPNLKDNDASDYGLMRRLNLIPFENTIPVQDRIPEADFMNKYDDPVALAGVLEVLLTVFKQFREDGYRLPEKGRRHEYNKQFAEEVDQWGEVLNDIFCYEANGGSITGTSAYSTYIDYCTKNNTHKNGRRKFYEMLQKTIKVEKIMERNLVKFLNLAYQKEFEPNKNGFL